MGKKKKDKETAKTDKKQNRDHLFQPGQSGNPSGRKKGTKNFSTLFDEAIKVIAKEKKLKINDVAQALIIRAYNEAKKGNFNFYRDIMDRRLGKAKDIVEVEGGLEFKLDDEQFNKIIRRRAKSLDSDKGGEGSAN